MARRSVWLVTGVVAGAASSLYAERKLRTALEAAQARLQPEALVTEVGRTARQAARSTGGRVRDAVATGRSEMHRREGEIWAGLGSPGPGAPEGVVVGDVSPGATDPSGESSTDSVDGAHATGGRGRRRARRQPSHQGR